MPPNPHNNPFPAPQIIPTPEILLPIIPGLFRNLNTFSSFRALTRNLALFVMLNNVMPGPDSVLIQHPVSVIPDNVILNNVIPDLIRDLFST